MNFMMINGQVLHVINSSVEFEERERRVWRIVTEETTLDDAMRIIAQSLQSAAEVQPAAPADATAARSIEDCPGGESCPGHATAACAKCRKPFDPADQSYAGRAQFPQTPFCCGCITRCHDSESADHWCAVDEWREKDEKPQGFGMPDALLDGFRKVTDVPEPQELFRNSGPAAPPVRLPRYRGPSEVQPQAPRPLFDGPPLLPARSTYVPCLGRECTGCSDPECWTVRADGGDQ